tara:strand:+ start:182 stop:412 length:231 start_codon:yes stop_codon:yes gene_type:complete
MAGLFSNDEHPSFAWGAKEEIFDNLGIPQKREDYLQDLSGTGNLERQMAAQYRNWIEMRWNKSYTRYLRKLTGKIT